MFFIAIRKQIRNKYINCVILSRSFAESTVDNKWLKFQKINCDTFGVQNPLLKIKYNGWYSFYRDSKTNS